MRHYVYKITNMITGKYYVGKHSTKAENDNYMGSCAELNEDIACYGRENFFKEILFDGESEEEALEYEAKIVTQEFIDNPRTYNKTLGGRGSWKLKNVDNYARKEQERKFERSIFDKNLLPSKRKPKKPGSWDW